MKSNVAAERSVGEDEQHGAAVVGVGLSAVSTSSLLSGRRELSAGRMSGGGLTEGSESFGSSQGLGWPPENF